MNKKSRYLCLVIAFAFLTEPVAAQAPEFNYREAANEILKDSNHDDLRSKYADESLPYAAQVIAAMTADLPKNSDEEYRRIPWIWRLAIRSAKQGNVEQQRQLLLLSLPAEEKPLSHWQAVVLGGGLINGLSQRGEHPSEKIQELIKASSSASEIQQRFSRTVDLAKKMIDDQSVPGGTRYDALRILGASDWPTHAEQLKRYLESGVDDELQMGAVSAAADFSDPAATQTLIRALPKLAQDNRSLAIDMLVSRQPQRGILKQSVESGEVSKMWFTAEQLKQLDR